MIYYDKPISVALVDDHIMLRTAVAEAVIKFKNCSVLFGADDGEHMKTFIEKQLIPDVLLLDIDMPIMDGFESAIWLTKHYPQIKIVALSMNIDEKSIVRMMRYGCKSFLDKASSVALIEETVHAVMLGNFFMDPYLNDKYIKGLKNPLYNI